MTPDPAAVPDGWQTLRLGDVIAGSPGGGTPSRAVPAYWGGPIPWATVKDMGDRVLTCTEESITEEGVAASATRVIPAGTVVVATRMAVGAVAWTAIATAINQDLKALVPGDRLDSGFLLHFMLSRASQMEAAGTGTTVKGVSIDFIRRLELLLPPLPEQRAIAAVLDGIDDAIERTEKVIAATERVRDALLHELLTRGLPGRHSEWAEVPGLGTVPACWDIVRLGDVTTVRNGATPSRSCAGYWEGDGVPFVKTGRVNDISIEQPDEFISSRAVESTSAVIVPAGSVLIAMIGQGRTRGKAARLRFDAAINQNFAAVYDAVGELSLDFIFLWAQHNYAAIRNRGQGTNQDALNCDLIEGLRLPRPSGAEQDEIAAFVGALSEREASEGRLLRELRHAKAAAAEALLTGRVRVAV